MLEPDAMRMKVALVAAVLTVVVAMLVAWLSLHDVPGVQRTERGGCCETTFVHDGLWATMFLLALPIGFIARRSLLLAVGTSIAASIATFAVAHEVVHRYAVSGWSDGLEVFAYVEAAAMTFVWVLAAVVGRAAWPVERRVLGDDWETARRRDTPQHE
jgi:hypothetical protein